jgi:hypothetical protein
MISMYSQTAPSRSVLMLDAGIAPQRVISSASIGPDVPIIKAS